MNSNNSFDDNSKDWKEFVGIVYEEEDCNNWTELEKKRDERVATFVPESWDFPLAVLNEANTFKSVQIGDKEFHRLLNSENPAESCSHKITISSCLCGETSTIKTCSKCHVVFCNFCAAGPNETKGHAVMPRENGGVMPRENGGMWPQMPVGVPEYPEYPPMPPMNMWGGMPMQMPVQRLHRDPHSFQNQMGFSQQMNLNYSSFQFTRAHMPMPPPGPFQGPQRPPHLRQGPPQAHQGPPQAQALPSSSRYSEPSVEPTKSRNKTKKSKIKPIANKAKAAKMEPPAANIVDDLISFGFDKNDNGPEQLKCEILKPDSIQAKRVSESSVQSHEAKSTSYNASDDLSDFQTMSIKSDDLKDDNDKIDISDVDFKTTSIESEDLKDDNSKNDIQNVDFKPVSIWSDDLNEDNDKIDIQNVDFKTMLIQSDDLNDDIGKIDISDIDFKTTSKESDDLKEDNSKNHIQDVDFKTIPIQSNDLKDDIDKIDIPNADLETVPINSNDLKEDNDKITIPDVDFKNVSINSTDMKDDNDKIDIPNVNKILLKEEETPKTPDVANYMPRAALANVNNLPQTAVVNNFRGMPLTPMRFAIANRRKPIVSSTKIAEDRLKVPKFTALKGMKSPSELMASKEAVVITHFYSFDKIHIVTAAAHNWDLKLLREDIFELIESDEKKMFEFTPDVGSVILAPYRKSKQEQFCRAVIEEVFDPIIVVRFFDVGSRDRVRVGSVYQITEELMKIPIFGQEVTLKDIDASKTDLILMSDFSDFTKNWPEKTPCYITSVDLMNSQEIVNLKCPECKDFNTVSEGIINLGRWQWQNKWERGQGMTEEKLCGDTFWKVDIGHIRKLKKFENTTVTVASRKPNSAEIYVLFNVETETYFRDRDVLQQQIELFLKCVGSDVDHFPAMGECVFVKILPNEDPMLKNKRGVGKWNRCVREGKMLINLDEVESYPVTRDYRGVILIRKYCPNFGKVPFLAVSARLKDGAPTDEKKEQIIQEVLQEGSIVTISTSNPDAGNVEIVCEELLDRLAELDD